MRVISGKYKGTKLEGKDLIGTRPTMDRVKESMIATIQTKIKNSVCLDLFAGSGSIGIELLSNGAEKCYFVDNNRHAINTIYKNTVRIDKNKISILQKDYKDALLYFCNNEVRFDIIYLDPPYELNLISSVIGKIKECDLLLDKGIIVCEYVDEVIELHGYVIVNEKTYGDKKIMILEKN